MATGVRYTTPAPFEVDSEGVPVVGGQLFFYLTATSTPLDTYSDVALTVPNPNPMVADSSGHWGDIWLSASQAYKVRFYGPNPDTSIPSTPANPQGVLVWSRDPVGPAAGGATQVVSGIIGEVRDFAGPAASVPAQWYLCYGQAVSRATFSALFAVLGTTWGAGDGTTTFNLPDLRGRVTAGLDNMGGVGANRLTAGVSGVPATTLGGSGGGEHAQVDTLTAVSTVTDPGHNHVTNAVKFPDATPGIGIGGGAVGYTFNAAVNTANTTGLTVATTVASALTGTTQNVQPTAMVQKIIFGAA